MATPIRMTASCPWDSPSATCRPESRAGAVARITPAAMHPNDTPRMRCSRTWAAATACLRERCAGGRGPRRARGADDVAPSSVDARRAGLDSDRFQNGASGQDVPPPRMQVHRILCGIQERRQDRALALRCQEVLVLEPGHSSSGRQSEGVRGRPTSRRPLRYSGRSTTVSTRMRKYDETCFRSARANARGAHLTRSARGADLKWCPPRIAGFNTRRPTMLRSRG